MSNMFFFNYWWIIINLFWRCESKNQRVKDKNEWSFFLFMWSQGCPKVLPKLFPSCLKVLPKLCQSGLKTFKKMCQSRINVVSKFCQSIHCTRLHPPPLFYLFFISEDLGQLYYRQFLPLCVLLGLIFWQYDLSFAYKAHKARQPYSHGALSVHSCTIFPCFLGGRNTERRPLIFDCKS